MGRRVLTPSPWLVNARLLAKVNRFEFVTGVAIALIVAVAASLAAQRFSEIRVTPDCVRSWIASVPVTADCASAIATWSDLSFGDADRVMAAMVIAPSAAGLLIGAPIVAREIEAGTAPFAWAIAGSRLRWLVSRLAPSLLLVILLATVDSIAAGRLVTIRSADNVWSSVFDQSDFFGAPAIARAVATFAIGVTLGALIGRLLPAILVSIVVTVVLSVLVASLQPWFVRSTFAQTDVGAPGSALAFLRENPDADAFFVTQDNRVVLPSQAASEAPLGATDPLAWLADHARLVPLGVSQSATERWQMVSTTVLLGVSAILLGGCALIVRRRATR